MSISAGILGLLALGASALLVALDFTGGFLASGAHAVVSATPLALIALAYLVHQVVRRLTLFDWLKVLVLVSAFLLWSAYQLFPTLPGSAIFNDLAIGLFVLDIALIVGRFPRADDWAEPPG